MEEPGSGGRGGGRAQAAKRFRKMALVTAAVLGAGLVAATGFAFLSTNGATSTQITAAGVGSNYEFAGVYTSNSGLPTTVSNWVYGGNGFQTASWTPTVGQVGSVTQGGDLAMIDATGTTGNVLVTLVLSNAASLDNDYSYLNLPIGVSKCTSPSGTTCSWGVITTDANGDTIGNGGVSYLTLTNGELTFLLPGNAYYELTIPTGGSFYTISSNSSDLSPSYLINIQSAG